jgi:hypothetical protein
LPTGVALHYITLHTPPNKGCKVLVANFGNCVWWLPELNIGAAVTGSLMSCHDWGIAMPAIGGWGTMVCSALARHSWCWPDVWCTAGWMTGGGCGCP